jgi:hypothetical protein
MENREFPKLYIRSPAGIVSLVGAAGAAILLFATSGPLAALAGALGVLGVSALLALFTPLGARAAAAEAERQASARALQRLAAAAEARARLAALRLAEPAVSSARDLLVMEADRFIEAGRAGAYDPQAAAAIEEGLGLVDAWLKEADAAAVEKRFGLVDADPFPEAASRTAAALRAKAELVARGRGSASGEIPPSDAMEIEEELR